MASASPSRTILDEALPEFDARSAHQTWVPVPPRDAFAAVKAVTVREVRLLVPLMALRGLPRRLARGRGFRPAADTPALDAALDFGFVRLGERPGEEIVVGVVGRFWRLAGAEPVELRTAADFAAFAEPGYAKAAMGFVVRPEGSGSRVVTETRVLATSEDARRAFLRYWRLVRGGSGAVRRSWLAAVGRRAARP